MLPAAVTTLQALTGIDLVMITDLSGKVIASTDTLLVDETLPWPELVADPDRSHSGVDRDPGHDAT